MSIIYQSPVDNMNLRKFKIFVTGKYEPKLPKYFINNNVSPFYSEVDRYAHSSVAPEIIVDLCYHEMEFTIPDIEDFKTIIDIIKIYIDAAENLTVTSADMCNYVIKCKAALEKLEPEYERFYNFLKNKYPDKYKESKSIMEELRSDVRLRL